MGCARRPISPWNISHRGFRTEKDRPEYRRTLVSSLRLSLQTLQTFRANKTLLSLPQAYISHLPLGGPSFTYRYQTGRFRITPKYRRRQVLYRKDRVRVYPLSELSHPIDPSRFLVRIFTRKSWLRLVFNPLKVYTSTFNNRIHKNLYRYTS